jgi:S-formylglutathione hydrolase
MTGTLVNTEIVSDLVPSPVEFSILLPGGYEEAMEKFPLLFFLHGGASDRSHLEIMRPLIEWLWEKEYLPGMVVVTPSVQRSFYMDYRDGSQKWELFIIGPFLEYLRGEFKIRHDRQATLLFGMSMGGMGALRLGFKHPELFGGLAVLEPAIEPVLSWREIRPEDRTHRSQELYEAIYGRPIDEDYWAVNNPATIVTKKADVIRSSDLAVYIECGDEDVFGFYRGTDFLHRILWEHRIPHEYHLVRWADHQGRTLVPRTIEGLRFLNKVINPPPPDPAKEYIRELLSRIPEEVVPDLEKLRELHIKSIKEGMKSL